MRFLLFFLFFAGQVKANSIEFIPNDLTVARFRAQKSGKLIVVKFYADWCAPCKVMDEYTWTEPELVEYVAENCVASKIDVDNFDGLSYKQHFSIERLPTTLLLDACGNEVARFENFASPERMVSWIQLFDKKQHRACKEGNSVALPEAFLATVKPAPGADIDSTEGPKKENFSGDPFINNITKRTESAVAPGQAPEPMKNPGGKKNKKKNSPEPAPTKPAEHKISVPGPKPVIYQSNHPEEPIPTVTNFPPPNPPELAPSAYFATSAAPSGAGIFWEMKKPAGFAVQVMASSTAVGADEMKILCLSQFAQKPVAVVSPNASGDNLYRVLVGIFTTKIEAEKFKKQVRILHKDAFIRNLSSF